MWGDGQTSPGRSPFSRQFEPDGQRFLYRKDLVGQGVPVLKEERDAFVAAYDSVLLWVAIALITVGSVLLGIGSLIGEIYEVSEIEVYLIPSILILMGVFVWWRWRTAWSKPAKALAERERTGTDRSPQQARRLRMALAGWQQLLICVGVTAFFIEQLFENPDLRHGAARLLLVPAVMVAAGLGVWAIVKHRALRDYRRTVRQGADRGDASRMIR